LFKVVNVYILPHICPAIQADREEKKKDFERESFKKFLKEKIFKIFSFFPFRA